MMTLFGLEDDAGIVAILCDKSEKDLVKKHSELVQPGIDLEDLYVVVGQDQPQGDARPLLPTSPRDEMLGLQALVAYGQMPSPTSPSYSPTGNQGNTTTSTCRPMQASTAEVLVLNQPPDLISTDACGAKIQRVRAQP